MDCIHQHIRQLPVCSSHYSRTKNPNRQYLEANNSISLLYMKYRSWMNIYHIGVHIVNKRYYNKIFSTNYNIGFRPTRKDTCNTCVRLNMSITLDKEAGKNVENIDKELEDHKSRAIVAYDCMKSAKKAKKMINGYLYVWIYSKPCNVQNCPWARHNTKERCVYTTFVFTTSSSIYHTCMFGRNILHLEGLWKSLAV